MVEQSEKIQICPYWKKFVIQRDQALALCGMESPKEPHLPDTDLGPRLSRCPWFSLTAIYDSPAIVLSKNERRPSILDESSFPGALGLAELEPLWEREVAKFNENLSNSY